MKPLVVIAGRPNVGKSTLLNRILGRREAIVEQQPGVTRDRKVVEVDWRGHEFRLADTGGWLPSGESLDDKVSKQAEAAMRDGDVVVLVVDANIGLTEEDSRVAQVIKRLDRPVFVVANKVDDSSHEPLIWEFLKLGLADPFPVSALHGQGTADLLDAIVEVLPGDETEDLGDEAKDPTLSVAIVGRPNVGKSTLFNRLIGEERSVVHNVAGTTRDTVDTIVDTDQGPVRFIDTAGMRRKAKVDDSTEYYSVIRALHAVDRADVALLVIDSTVGVTHQDQRLAERADAAGCPTVVLLNKWDRATAEEKEVAEGQIAQRLHFLGEAPVLRISGATGRGVHRIWEALEASGETYRARIPTTKVNRAIREAQSAQPAPAGARVLYATQAAIEPPTFILFANKPIPQTYVRYLERKLRETFDLGSTPLKLRVRRRD